MTDNKETDSKNALSAEDIELWREMTRDVKPMEGRGYVRHHEEKPAKVKQKKASKPRRDAAPVIAKETAGVKRGVDIDRNTMKRLKRGEIAIDAWIDLHGMNQGAARQALIGFIRNCHASGHRCVLVVTGKGNTGQRSDDWFGRTPGVLKQNVPLWLRESELDGLVLQAVSARPKDGGDGALYVYLRRNRV